MNSLWREKPVVEIDIKVIVAVLIIGFLTVVVTLIFLPEIREALKSSSQSLMVSIKGMNRTGDDTIDLTLTFTTDTAIRVNEYKIKVVLRSTAGDGTYTTTILDRAIEPISAETIVDRVYHLWGISGYTDLWIEVYKGSNLLVSRTQRIPS